MRDMKEAKRFNVSADTSDVQLQRNWVAFPWFFALPTCFFVIFYSGTCKLFSLQVWLLTWIPITWLFYFLFLTVVAAWHSNNLSFFGVLQNHAAPWAETGNDTQPLVVVAANGTNSTHRKPRVAAAWLNDCGIVKPLSKFCPLKYGRLDRTKKKKKHDMKWKIS